MKNILIAYFFISGITISFSQYHPFPSDNSVWQMMTWENIGGMHTEDIYGICGDTIINDTLYSKLYSIGREYDFMEDTTYFYQGVIGGIREDNDKKIWFWEIFSNQTILLYDFGLIEGDTFFDMSYNYGHSIILDSIGLSDINGELHSTFYFDDGTIWLEGIGSIQGLFKTSVEYDDPDFTPVLMCFRVNNDIYYGENLMFACNISLKDQGCIFTKITSLFKNSYSHLIYPNPANGFIIIETDYQNLSQLKIHIYNNIGQISKTINSISASNFIIDTDKLSSGFHIVQIIDAKENKVLNTEKIIIQK